MAATFIIEISLVIYTLWRYRLNSISKISSILLLCLAVFQLAEYGVCEGALALSSTEWAKLGYVAITLLPPLGIHLIARLSGDKRVFPVVIGYSMSMLFIGIFLFVTNGISADACLGNYVIFQQAPGTGIWYGMYYYGLLIAAIGYALHRARAGVGSRIRQAMHMLVVGYLIFMVPTTIVNTIDPSTISGIPSIMCGFAVFFAVLLVFGVLPQALTKRS